MDIHDTIKKYRTLVEKRLRVFLKERIRRVKDISPSSVDMMEHIMEFNMRGGKRIRPILVIFGYKALGGKNEDAIIDAAIAVELMESFLLIHDDIMDQDELRRGYLTMHKIYENKCKRHHRAGDAKRFGESMALVAGDILSILGSEAILQSRFPVKKKLRAISIFNKAVINTCFGQIIDIRAALEPDVAENDIQRLYELKTAVYTFEAPLQIGAVLAGAGEKELKLLSRYAISLGKAFQLHDDLLGLFGSRKKIGKPVGSDIREGKKTLLIVRATATAKKRDREFILKCLGNKDITAAELAKLRKIVAATGAMDYTKELAFELKEKSKSVIYGSALRSDGKRFLLGLADYVVKREY